MDFAVGGVAAMCAGLFTNPLEVVKTRMQLQGELRAKGSHAVHYKNVAHAFIAIAKADGILALQNGLVPALWFQLFLNGFRLGSYQVADSYGLTKDSKGELSTWRSLIVGACGGALGAASGSPFYLIKTHLQSKAATSIAVGHQHTHSSMSSALLLIYKQDGIKGLYRGVSSSIPRGAVGSAAQLATFSRCKDYLNQKQIFPNSPLLTSFVASMIGGTIMTMCMNPFDVVATRLYNQGVDAKGKGLLYNGIFDCFTKVWTKEGMFGFYKGFWASYSRLGPHTVLVLVFWDELKIVKEKYF